MGRYVNKIAFLVSATVPLLYLKLSSCCGVFLNKIYEEFESDALSLYETETTRISLKFDPAANYTQDQLMDAMREFAGNDIESTGERYTHLSTILPDTVGQNPTQDELNKMYRLVQEEIQRQERDGPLYGIDDIKRVANSAKELDEIISSYLSETFTFYKPRFSKIEFENDPGSSLNLLINDSYLKFECFIGTSLATLGHVLREVCNPRQGFLSRVILARTLFEIALHQLFLVRKLLSLTVRVKSKEIRTSYDEFLSFGNLFARGMYGSKSPYRQNHTNSADPYNIRTCIECLKNPAGELTIEEAKDFYGHLCDFAHPNLGMRSLLFELQQSKGDYFSTEVKIDRSLECRQHVAYQNDVILHCVEIVHTLISCALREKETVRENMNDKNIQTFGEGNIRFNSITSRKRPTLDKKET